MWWLMVIAWCLAEEPATGWIEGTVEGGRSWVYVAGLGPLPATPGRGVLGQTGQMFEKDAIAVVAGDTVDFPNHGPDVHDVNWVTTQYSDQLGTYPAGQTRSATFSAPGVYPIGCNRHSQMSASILVVPNGWYVETARDGTFRIPDVTPGPHEVVAWSPNGPTQVSTTVTVTAGQGTRFNPRVDTR